MRSDSTGVPGVTVNELASDTISELEVSVTVRVPVAADGSMLMTAVTLVADATASEFTVTPAPKLAVVTLWAK